LNDSKKVALNGTTFIGEPTSFCHGHLNEYLPRLSISKLQMLQVIASCEDALAWAGFIKVKSLGQSCSKDDMHYWVSTFVSVLKDGEVIGEIAIALPHKPVSPSAVPKKVDFYVSDPDVIGEDTQKLLADILLLRLYPFCKMNVVGS